MAKRYGSLVKKAVVLIDQFPASKNTLDDFIEDAFKSLKVSQHDHNELSAFFFTNL